jgi:hypothetical protein
MLRYEVKVSNLCNIILLGDSQRRHLAGCMEGVSPSTSTAAETAAPRSVLGDLGRYQNLEG